MGAEQSGSLNLILILVMSFILILVYLNMMRRSHKTSKELSEQLTDALKGYFNILGFFEMFLKEENRNKKIELFEKTRKMTYDYQQKFPASPYMKDIYKIEKKLVEFMEKEGLE